MNSLLKPLLILFLLTPFLSIAQTKEIYVDENMNSMNKEQFLKNCSKRIYRCSGSVSDSLIVNKIHSRYKFGKISPEVHEKILSELHKNNKPNIDQTIVLKFTNGYFVSYKSYIKNKINEEAFRKKEGFIVQNGKKKYFKRKLSILSESRYIKLNESNLNRANRCLKKINKKTNSEVYHLVKNDIDSLKNISKHLSLVNNNDYLEDIRSGFSDSTRYVVINPKGEFYSSETIVHPDDIIELLNNDDWSKYKRDLKYSNSLKHKKGYGFFKSFPIRYRNRYSYYETACF